MFPMPLSAIAMQMNMENQLVEWTRAYNASNLFKESMYSNIAFLPSFNFVNKNF